MALMKGGWGYRPDRAVVPFEEIAVYLSDCSIRNINYLLNVSPDREGVIPQNQREVLGQVGRWMDKVGPAIHRTRGGPWQPQFGEFGFSYRDDTIYAHVFAGYRERGKNSFRTHSIGQHSVKSVKDLATGRELPWTLNDDRTVSIREVDYSVNPAVTILEVKLNGKIELKP